MNTIFYISFSISFICLLVRTVFHLRDRRQGRGKDHKKVNLLFSITMFFFWFTWFSMSFFDPIRMDISSWFTCTGLTMFTFGVVFVVLSHIKIKGFESGKLIRKGIYSKFRHPMYLGFILWIIGFPLFMKAFITLLSSVLWIPQILYWKIYEEKEMEKKYDDYKDYKKETWF